MSSPQYIETPQYLRKQLVPMHPDLRFAGLLSPLDAPHHVRADEWSAYREGVVVDRPAAAPARTGENGSYVYIGTKKEVRSACSACAAQLQQRRRTHARTGRARYGTHAARSIARIVAPGK